MYARELSVCGTGVSRGLSTLRRVRVWLPDSFHGPPSTSTHSERRKQLDTDDLASLCRRETSNEASGGGRVSFSSPCAESKSRLGAQAPDFTRYGHPKYCTDDRQLTRKAKEVRKQRWPGQCWEGSAFDIEGSGWSATEFGAVGAQCDREYGKRF